MQIVKAFLLGVALALGTASQAQAQGPAALPNFDDLVEKHGPEVVNIRTEARAQRTQIPGLSEDDPMFEFFRRFMPPDQRGAPRGRNDKNDKEDRRGPLRPFGLGSGFVISADGYIVTNAHVIDNAEAIYVRFTDKREMKAKVIGADKRSDVALVKVEATGLPFLKLGDSTNMRVGEWVVAIGSPFGFANSVTAGILSAKSRDLPADSTASDAVPFLQTDVAVNPGNSGGPLFNTRGEVVGINSQIYSRTGGYQGVSFAIPIDVANRVKDQIIATGKASHARLGVAVQEVNQTFADSFKLSKPEGALISSVEPDGPADKAGLKSGDVILKVDGQPIVSSGDLPALIGQAAPGQKVTMQIWRQGKAEDIVAKLGDASDKPAKVAAAGDEALGKAKLGLALRPLQPGEKREAGVGSGLLIEDVAGPAAMAGVQPGDVLLAINGTPVTQPDQVRAAVAKADKSVALLIQRDGQRIFVPVHLG